MCIQAMVKDFWKRMWLVSVGLLVCLIAQARIWPDSVVMTVAGRQVLFSEFVFIARKNGEVDLSDARSVKAYVSLFADFKRKVAEAESRGFDKTDAFKEELDGYCAQLIRGLVASPEGQSIWLTLGKTDGQALTDELMCLIRQMGRGERTPELYRAFGERLRTDYRCLAEKHPEIPGLMQEYRDGILLFEVSEREIWSKPVSRQDALEKRWIKYLGKKYPVSVNWKLVKKLEK